MISSPHLVAALDLGSNSFHLVVARVEGEHISFLDRVKETVRLAEGLLPDGTLDEGVQQRALTSLRKLGQRLSGLDQESVRVVGTNTLRAAKNSREFLARAEQALGFPIHVISGQEEARLIYLGVTHHLRQEEESRLVIDIGGGSTEIILGRGQRPLSMESLHMGCVSFTRKFFSKGKISPLHFELALHVVQRELEPFRDRFASGNWSRAIGASGTVKSVETCIRELSNGALGIGPQGMDLLLHHLERAGRVENLNLRHLSPMRAPILAAGAIILAGIVREFGLNQLAVSPFALREGVLLDLIGRHTSRDIRRQTIRAVQERLGLDKAHAERVGSFAAVFFVQLRAGEEDAHTLEMLEFAAMVHESGLAVSHASYHKHGAYLMRHSDLPGFDRADQETLAFLVLNHRRRLRPDPNLQRDWGAVLALRLAVLLLRGRQDKPFPPLRLSCRKGRYQLELEQAWLADRPLTLEALQGEEAAWKTVGIPFRMKEVASLAGT